MPYHFSVVPGAWAVVQLARTDAVPIWALSATGFVSITRTDDELSIVCAAAVVPDGLRCELGWSALKLIGPFPFAEVGVLASFTAPLARASISLFAISTFDTDYILLKHDALTAACNALVAAGHILE